jgi:hypothetical protein
LLLSGCGGGSVTPSAPKVASTPAGLAGNWLITNSMPTWTPNASSGFELALTVDVLGSSLVAAAFGDISCGSTGSLFLDVMTGTVGADGSFTLQTQAGSSSTISIKGVAPQAAGEAWLGSFASSFPAASPTCAASNIGFFTATSFPLVSGVYTGTGSTQTLTGVAATPITFQLSLQQGGTVTDASGKPFTSNVVLSGSIRVQGSPCFSSGATSSGSPSSVEGNTINTAFVMDDGSTLILLGTLTDISEGHIATTDAVVSGGTCASVPTVYQLSGLDRQS